MSEKQFVVEELEILNDENDFKGEYWWAVTNTERVEDCFECRNKEVALKLCDFLNKSSDDFKWQIRQCEKWSAIVKRLKKENEQLQKELQRFKKYVFSQDNILCYKCEHCIKKDIYVVDCEMKGEVDVHGLCSLFREVKV